MIRFGAVFWLAIAGVSAAVLFQVKHEVQGLVDSLAATEDAIRRDREAIRVLKAEWSYLDRPARIAELAERHLGLVPLKPQQIAGYEVLPERPEDFGQVRLAGAEPLPRRKPEELAAMTLAAARAESAARPAPQRMAAAPVVKVAAKPAAKPAHKPAAKAPPPQAAGKAASVAAASGPARRLNPVTGRPLPLAGVTLVSGGGSN